MRTSQPSTGRLFGGILLLTLIGGVLVAYLWETLNRLFSLTFEPLRLLLSVPVLIVFVLLLRYVGRLVEGWSEQRDAGPRPPGGS
ncbi:MAG: hypothetical protein KFH98_03975 [Gemmatimonadetes bacterium]|nr:hypothetical protein [Gemmatimonadota bacterium]